MHGRLLPGVCFNALTPLECQYNQKPATATETNAVQLFLLLLRSSSVAAQKNTGPKKIKKKKGEKKGCFSLKAVGEGRTALCGKEETTSSVFRCLQLWQKQSHPKWLMSRQAGCEEQSTRPVAELAVGIPQGEVGCSDTAERRLGAAYRELTAQKAAALSGADVLIIGGFCKDLSHAPILCRWTKDSRNIAWPLALGGFGPGESNSI